MRFPVPVVFYVPCFATPVQQEQNTALDSAITVAVIGGFASIIAAWVSRRR